MPKRMLQGVVVSNRQDKTVVVMVDRRFTHPIYKKTIRRSKKYHAHDEKNDYQPGDIVRIEESPPISKLKRWRVIGGQKIASRRGHDLPGDTRESNRQRNESGKEALRKENVNREPVSNQSVTNAGVAFDALIKSLLTLGLARVDELVGAQLSSILRSMDTNTINERIRDLLFALDHDDKNIVSGALTTLSIVLPRLDLETCLRDAELRKTLYRTPDRLMAALSENLDTTTAAKKAAFALVAAMYPEHYNGDNVAADEKTALSDLQNIFEENHVTSFFTVNAKAATDVASIDARLWTGVPFKLYGVTPRLAYSKLFDHRGDFDICQLKGAKKLDVIKTDHKRLYQGQFAGLTAKLKPDPDSAVHNKVVVYFGNDHDIYRREVFDLKALFPKQATPR